VRTNTGQVGYRADGVGVRGAEAEERWVRRNAWKRSRQRVSQFSKAGLDRDQGRGRRTARGVAGQARRDGVEPGSAEANALAAQHRASIDRFYDGGDEMHRSLMEMIWPTNGSPAITTTSSRGWRIRPYIVVASYP